VVGFTGFVWFYNGRGAIRHKFGSPLRNIATDSSKGNTLSWKSGSVENWSGGVTVTNQLPFPIDTVAAGSDTVTLKTPALADLFVPGAWVRVTGYNIQTASFPPNWRYNEWRRVVSANNSTGEIVLDKPLVYAYSEDWHVYTDAGFAILDTGYVQTVGPGGIMPLERGSSSHFSELLEIDGLHVLNNPADSVPIFTSANGEEVFQSGFVGINGAARVIVRNVRAGYAFTGECPLAEFFHSDFSLVEADKNSGLLRFTSCGFGDILGGTGYDRIELHKCEVRGNCQVSPKHFLADDGTRFLREDTLDAFNYNGFCREVTELRGVELNRTGNNFITVGAGNVSPTVASSVPIPRFRWEVFDTPSAGLFRVADADDLTTNVNVPLRRCLVPGAWLYREDGRRFRVLDVTWDGDFYTVAYVSEDAGVEVAAEDVLGANRSRLWHFENVRRTGGRPLPHAQNVDADEFVSPQEGRFGQLFDIVIPAKGYISASALPVGGFVSEIEVWVTRAYTGAGLPNGGYVQVSTIGWAGVTMSSFIKSSILGRRLLLTTGTAGAGMDNRNSGDFVNNLPDPAHCTGIQMDNGDVDNAGDTGWDGFIRVKGVWRWAPT
jgi:hypothetical protein